MKRLTVTLSDDLETRFDAYLRDRGVSPADVVRDALREYLESDARPTPERPLHFTPVENGSGKHDISINHDRYLTDG